VRSTLGLITDDEPPTDKRTHVSYRRRVGTPRPDEHELLAKIIKALAREFGDAVIGYSPTRWTVG
jgi:hypothetical protein